VYLLGTLAACGITLAAGICFLLFAVYRLDAREI
jgi:hypothetical protein